MESLHRAVTTTPDIDEMSRLQADIGSATDEEATATASEPHPPSSDASLPRPPFRGIPPLAAQRSLLERTVGSAIYLFRTKSLRSPGATITKRRRMLRRGRRHRKLSNENAKSIRSSSFFFFCIVAVFVVVVAIPPASTPALVVQQ